MNYKESGGNNKDAIIFLHGVGLSWWNYREVAESGDISNWICGRKVRVVL